MSAAPIAHYLLELEAGDDAGASSASGLRAGKPLKAAKATVAEEAHAKGFESGKAAADAQLAGKLEQQEAKLARQEKQIEALIAGFQKVSAQLEASKPAPQVVVNP